MELKSILIIEDGVINIDILLELLGDKYETIVAIDASNALEVLEKQNVDLILLDIVMPVMDGFELCELIKTKDKIKDIPVIFITSNSDEDSIERAYEVGGIDYITKPFKPRELLMRVKTQLKLQDMLISLERAASYDMMTNIYNRRKLFELGIKRYNQHKVGLCAVIIDIDKFKTINDTYGHPMGDTVIKMIVDTISKNIPPESIFARLGGDELALIINETSIQKMTNTMETIRLAIKNTQLITEDGERVNATISKGIAYYHDGINSLDELFKEADIALYEAKEKGRDKVVFR